MPRGLKPGALQVFHKFLEQKSNPDIENVGAFRHSHVIDDISAPAKQINHPAQLLGARGHLIKIHLRLTYAISGRGFPLDPNIGRTTLHRLTNRINRHDFSPSAKTKL